MPKLYVTVEGGIVQGFASDHPELLEHVEIIVIDYDQTEDGSVLVDQGNGRPARATIIDHSIDDEPLVIRSRTEDRGTILGLPVESNILGCEICELCDAEYDDGGDGWDGLCPTCADRVSAMMDKHKLDRDAAITLASSTMK